MDTEANQREIPPSAPSAARTEPASEAGSAEATALVDSYRKGELSRDALEQALRGVDLVGADLSGLDLAGLNLAGLNLSRARFDGVVGVGLNLAESSLVGASFHDAELACANLDGVDLRGAHLERCGLGKASLRGASAPNALFDGASCVEMDAEGAEFDGASFRSARLTRGHFARASFVSARFDAADLEGAEVTHTDFRRAVLESASVRGLRNFRGARWVGTDIRGVDDVGISLWRRHVLDENLLDEFRRQSQRHEWIYRLWWLTSDCGRSTLRWGLCSGALVVAFALLYCVVGIDFGEAPTALSPLYFSVVTFTTLGYGDIVPTTAAGQLAVIGEVVIGYVMLGGLLALVSDKLAFRGAS